MKMNKVRQKQGVYKIYLTESGKEVCASMVSDTMDHGCNFDDITYNAEVWLPGTDSLGVSNGSVRTYGVWTAKNSMNGNIITNKAYHSFEFNGKGQIHELRDYFDASGLMAAAMNASEE